MNNSLVYFTASYPYGSRETYLHNEILMMSKCFDNIYVIPIYNPTKSSVKRITPSNVKIFEPLVPQGFPRVIGGLFNFSPFMLYIKEFFSKNIYRDKRKMKKWFNSLLVYRIVHAKFKRISQELPSKTILYSYWAEAPLFTSRFCQRFVKVLRMHGGDFYLVRNQNYLPLRSSIYQKCDLLLPISQDIRQILIDHYKVDEERIFLNYLGTYNTIDNISNRNSLCGNDGVIRIVSCSNVYELKRVHLIVDILAEIESNRVIEWHHFGTGEKDDMEFLENKVKVFDKKKVTAIFHGQVNQKQLYEFYGSNYIHWFMNVSKYEGLPVSIMEAFSFGIPAIATDVGATREIVNESNGYLIPECFNLQFVASQITNIGDKELYESKRENALLTWKTRFDASKNYVLLAEKLKNI